MSFVSYWRTDEEILTGKFLRHALKVWTNRRVLGRSAGFPAGPACGSIHLYDRWRLRSIEELEMRLGGPHREAVDRQHVLRTGRERDNAVHLGAQ